MVLDDKVLINKIKIIIQKHNSIEHLNEYSGFKHLLVNHKYIRYSYK